MKYVFVINSALTHAVAKKIVDSFRLSKDDCLFVFGRYKTHNISFVNYVDLHKSILVGTSIKPLFGLYTEIIKVRKRINESLLNEPYICFIYHSACFLTQSLVTSPNCRGFYITEEGLGSYMFSYQVSSSYKFVRRLLHRLFSFNILGSLDKYIYNTESKKFIGVVSLNKHAFPSIKKNINIGFPFMTVSLSEKIEALYVFDGGLLDDKMVCENIRYMLQTCWIYRHPIVHYKFHPAQTTCQKEKFRSMFAYFTNSFDINFVELDYDVVLEDICFTLREKLCVYFLNSSVGIYASMLGCRSFSSAKKFKEKSNVLNEFINNHENITSDIIFI